jgi:hypothetical protein
MSTEQLIAKLKRYAKLSKVEGSGPERAHALADRALLDFIGRPQHNQPETVAFQSMQGLHVLGDFPGLQTLFALVGGQRLYADEQLTRKIRTLDPKALEAFVICKRKNGRKVVWDVWLSNGSEKARAEQEAPAVYEQLQTPLDPCGSVERASSLGQISGEVVEGKAGMPEVTNVLPPAPLLDQLTESVRVIEMRKPIERVGRIEPLAATGTDGPVTTSAAVGSIKPTPATFRPAGPIPWNIAFREVLQFVTAELKSAGEQWGDQAKQDFVSTVLISAAKSKLVGVWER